MSEAKVSEEKLYSFNSTDLTLLRGFIGTKHKDFSLGSDYVLCIQ